VDQDDRRALAGLAVMDRSLGELRLAAHTGCMYN
jgi:hypothetical protein